MQIHQQINPNESNKGFINKIEKNASKKTASSETILDSQIPFSLENPEEPTVSFQNATEANTLQQPKAKNNETKDADFYNSSIEEALDFCEESQKFRAKKDVESALNALDQAYRIIIALPKDENTDQQQLDDLRFTIAKRILELYSARTRGTKGMANEIPLPMNSHVQKELKRLTGREKRYFIYSYKRAGKYMPMIQAKLKKANLPKELAWLPLIESGFKEKALSKARALGLWQFIPSTGYKFGLKRNLYIDERLDPEASTDAAIAYLKELHEIFGDWFTVLAAYNCGEGRVLRIIRRQNVKYLDNFWDLYLQLPYETARYVPKFIATLYIIKNLKKYGFDNIEQYKPLNFEKIHIQRPILLKDVARATNSDFSLLERLNPALKYKVTPPKGYVIRIPKGTSEILKAELKNIRSRVIEKSYVMHKVKKGETLSWISQKYRTSIKSIMLANRLRKSNFLSLGQLLKIPGKSYYSTNYKKRLRKTAFHKGNVIYTVKKGDSLWEIARKFSTSCSKLKTINNIASETLSIGQKLKIKISSLNKSLNTYKVRPGDSPFKIASQHNMSLNRFLNINSMTRHSRIFPGQKVFVE